MSSSSNSQRNMENSKRNNRTPNRANVQNNPYNNTLKTPKADKSKFRNDVSPFRGRFGSNVKTAENKSRKTPERNLQSRSPISRDLKINTRFESNNYGIKNIGK
jgi:hypothetical protein